MKKARILYLGNQLSKHGLNKTTIETLGPQLQADGFDIISVSDRIFFPFRMLDMIRAVIKFRKQISYVLIDTYSTKAFWYAFVCSQIARILKINYISILHGGDLPNRLHKNPKLCALVFKNAYTNVAPSGYLQHAFEKEGYTNIIYIPNSIEVEKYIFKPREKLTPKLLWVRAFASIYNSEMAVSVLFELQKKYPNATLTMVGPDKDGSLITTKSFATSLGVSVNFTGKLAKEDWWQLAASHDIFINTTHFDNTPVSVMEAMALGLPVVSTNVGGIPYLLTHNENALLVADNAIPAMVEALEVLLEQSIESNRLIHNARLFVEQMDWKVIKSDWFQLLK